MKIVLLWLIVAILVLSNMAGARQNQAPDKTRRDRTVLQKGAGSFSYAILNIGNLTAWVRSDGIDFSPSSDNSVYFPRGTANIIYKDGFVWGAEVFLDPAHTTPVWYHVVRVGGTTYGTSTRAGYVTGLGATAVAVDPQNPEVRTYRIRRDYFRLKNADGSFTDELRRDAGDMNEIPTTEVSSDQMDRVYAQYGADWTEWPVQFGAPFVERNGIPGYQPPPMFGTTFTVDSLISGIYDEPGISGPSGDSPADQVIWTVYNDLNASQALSFASSEPLGLEIQKTQWGYKSTSNLADMYFVRYRIINKGGVDTSLASGLQPGAYYLDSMFVCQWSDADLGSFSDDLIGCDTTLSLGFVYNANDIDASFRNFGLPPPSVGYRLLQGPLVPSPGDTGKFNMRMVAGSQNLPMSSCVPAYPPVYSEPPSLGGYALATGQLWKLMRGYQGLGVIFDPDVLFPSGPYPQTKFPFSGDPVIHSGFVDGLGSSYSFTPGDRRLMVNTGPFSLALGDTQDVIYSLVAGLGADRLSSISVVKVNAKIAGALARRLFEAPRPPATPHVTVSALNQEIILDWGSDLAAVQSTESRPIAGEYTFEGYDVYQLPPGSTQLKGGKKIATFDRMNGITSIVDLDPTTPYLQEIVIQQGKDSGLQRFMRITKDYLSESQQDKLCNGQEYSFAVTAYNYTSNHESFPKSLESEAVIFTMKPQIPFGAQFSTNPGDSISVAHSTGSAGGTVNATVIDPLRSTGQSYEVHFDTSGTGITWSLVNATTGATILSDVAIDPAGAIVEGGILLAIFPSQSRPFSPGDVYRYTLPPVQTGIVPEKQSAKRVSVFPNPYYAGRSQETTYWRHFVTFNNLPPKVTIRIFNLAGHLIRTLEKNDPSQFLEWDLANQDNWQVASGMYICYIEMPDIGETKVLKLAVIQPQILPPY